MVSSLLFLTILVFYFDGNKIQLSDRRSHVNFLEVRHIFFTLVIFLLPDILHLVTYMRQPQDNSFL